MGTKCGERFSTMRRHSRLRRLSGWAFFSHPLTICVSISPLISANPVSGKTATPDAKPQSGWVIKQTTQTAGRQKLFVTARGIKLIQEDTHFTTIAVAPQWNVFLCNDAKKLYMQTTLNNYNGRYLRRLDQLRFADLSMPLRRGSNKTLFGVNTTIYLKGPILHPLPTDEVISVSVLALDQPPQPPEICSLICRMYGLSDLGKIPLGIKYNNLQNRERIRLSTQEIIKRNDISISGQPPAGYTKTTEESKLMLDSAAKSEMNDMIESLGK